jgi:hypothetical protein
MKTKNFELSPEIPKKKKTLSPEAKAKRRQFKAKFNIDKERLNEKDIISIITEIESEINESIDPENFSKKLMSKLDINNNGYVKTNDLIEEIVNRNEALIQDEFYEFFKTINEILKSKSEDIIKKLRRLQSRNWIVNEKKNFIPLIQNIINTIAEKNIYELENQTIDITENEGKKFLLKYSKLEDSNRKEKDFISMRSSSKKYSSSHLNYVPKASNKKRRSTNLTNLISPSIVASMYDQMNKIDKCDFNIFEVDQILGKKTSIYIAIEILNKFPFVENNDVPSDILKNFTSQIVEHYDRVNAIYHNDLHAGDVMQTSYTIFIQGDLKKKMKLKDLDIFALLVGALCHDYKHPGTNNLFQINTKSKYALRYNDTSVLEMYHLAQTFKELQHEDYNIFKNFSPEEYRICRRRMIDGILATDMANHAKVLSTMKTYTESYNIVKGENFEKIFQENDKNKSLVKLFDKQQDMLNMIIHTADISNPGKPDKISGEWTKRVYGEFFIQGDMEKELNLPISTFCDRNTTNVNKAMIGFISFVVGPTIDTLTNLVPEVYDYTEYCRGNLKKHKIGAKNDDRKVEAEKKKKEIMEKKKKNKEENSKKE